MAPRIDQLQSSIQRVEIIFSIWRSAASEGLEIAPDKQSAKPSPPKLLPLKIIILLSQLDLCDDYLKSLERFTSRTTQLFFSMIKTEICINSPESAVAAQKAGADRVELCANLLEGGTTPSIGAVQTARSRVDIGLHVIVRPRGGDFLFNDFEVETMKQDIDAMKQIGVDGIVIGSLTQDGEIDIQQTRALVERARPLSVTFHRAFDMCHDPIQSLESLIDLGVDRLLTSGQEESVIEGIDLIKELQEKANDRIIIMPGGGITPRNLKKLVDYTGVKEVHFAAMKTVPSEMVFRNDRVYMGGTLRPPEYESQVADENVIASMRSSLQ